MSGLSTLRRQLSEQMTPRVAFGLIAILAIGLFVGISELASRSDALETSVADMKAELRMLEDETSAGLWTERASSAAQIAEQWQNRDWSAATPGIASAEIQAAISSVVAQAGVTLPRVQVTGDPTEVRGRRVLRFEITSTGDAMSFIKMVTGLSTAPRRLIINEITAGFQEGGIPARLYIAGYAPYRGETPAPDASAQGAPGGAQ